MMIALASCPLHAKTILWWARSCLGPQCPKRAVSPIQVFKNCSKSVQAEAMTDSMVAESHLTFGPFRLERAPDRLWRGPEELSVRPRSLAVLRYLVEHPGRLVTKAEMRQHVWGGTHVSDTVLRVCVQEIRAALGDAAAAPQYLETVEPQGYRFHVTGDTDEPPPLTAGPIVGRQPEIVRLEDWCQRAAQGTRQLVFV